MGEHEHKPAFWYTRGDVLFIPDKFGGVFVKIEAVGNGRLTLGDYCYPDVKYEVLVPGKWTEWGKPNGVYLPTGISMEAGDDNRWKISNRTSMALEGMSAYPLHPEWPEISLRRQSIVV